MPKLLALLALVLVLPARVRAADDPPAHVNPSPNLTAVGPADEARQAAQVRGPMPAIDDRRLGRLRAGAIETRELPASRADALHFEAIGSVDGTPAEVMAVLRDYPHRAGLFPHVESCRATWDRNLALVDMELSVAMSTIRYRLAMRHFGDQALVWTYVHGDLKDSTGSYKLFPYDNGARTLVVYETESEPDSALPRFLLNSLTGKGLPGVIEAVRKGVATRRASR